MSSRHFVAEPADLLYLGTHQPALTILWQVSVDKRAVLVRHLHRPDLLLFNAPLLIDQRLMHRFTNEARSVFAHSPDRCIVGFVETHADGLLA